MELLSPRFETVETSNHKQIYHKKLIKDMDEEGMASSKEESEDLTSCSVCFFKFDMVERKPKFLPCSHTFCLSCIKVSQNFAYYSFSVLNVDLLNYEHLNLLVRQWLQLQIKR